MSVENLGKYLVQSIAESPLIVSWLRCQMTKANLLKECAVTVGITEVVLVEISALCSLPQCAKGTKPYYKLRNRP